MNEFKYIYLNIYIINKNYYLFFYDIYKNNGNKFIIY